MSLHQSILDMAAKLGWEVDDVICLVANFQLLLGVFLSCVVCLLFRLFRTLKVHFQKPSK